MFRTWTPTVLLAIGLALLSGCGGDDEPSADSTPTGSASPSATATAAIDPDLDCTKVFSAKAASTLAGVPVEAPTKEPFPGGQTACRWTATASGSTNIQVLAVDASDWAKLLPTAIGTVLDSGTEFAGRDKLDQALELVEGGGTLTDSAACDVFSTMVTSLQGQPKGTTRVFNYVPDDQDPQAVNGQACVGGRYYSVQLVSSDLQVGPATAGRIQAALDELIG